MVDFTSDWLLFIFENNLSTSSVTFGKISTVNRRFKKASYESHSKFHIPFNNSPGIVLVLLTFQKQMKYLAKCIFEIKGVGRYKKDYVLVFLNKHQADSCFFHIFLTNLSSFTFRYCHFHLQNAELGVQLRCWS